MTRRLDLYLRRVAGVVFLLAGASEFLLYWLL
jgi:hypothetical protein